MLNKVAIMGRLTAKPELKTTPSGISVVSFSIATQRSYKEKDTNEYATDFFNVSAWRKTAEFVCGHFRKGDMIAIDGTLQARTYTDKNGENRKVVEILADSVHFCGKKSEKNDSQPANAAANNYGNNVNANNYMTTAYSFPQNAPQGVNPANDFSSNVSDDDDYPF